MRAAFKEWAVVVDALGRGEQIVILRKGGISEGHDGFKLEHSSFFLFPTLFHQQRESVIPSAQERYDIISPNFPPPEILRLEYFAEVAFGEQLHSLLEARSLQGQHVWREEVVEQRFDWGQDKAIFALAARVFRLPKPVELPMLEAYGGCKSWVEFTGEVPTEGSVPVLSDLEFESRLERFFYALKKDETLGKKGDAPMEASAA